MVGCFGHEVVDCVAWRGGGGGGGVGYGGGGQFYIQFFGGGRFVKFYGGRGGGGVNHFYWTILSKKRLYKILEMLLKYTNEVTLLW